jgi:FkbH-like protein
VRPMRDADVPRVLELMSRTHQLNTTGCLFDRDEVVRTRDRIRVASLSDRFGDYGTVGVAIVEAADIFRLAYLAISCRVMGRGVERALLSTVLDVARRDGFPRVEALLRDTGTNRAMRVLYQMSGLRQNGTLPDGTLVFHAEAGVLPTPPPWIEVRAETQVRADTGNREERKVET